MSEFIEITLLRHGHSLADDEEKIEGRYDSPLTEIGIAQAQQRLEIWLSQSRQYDRVICSTLQRATKVAEIIAEGFQMPVESDSIWIEKDNGSLAGLSFDDADRLFPKPAFINPFQPHAVAAGNGESLVELYCRAALALQRTIRHGPSKTLVVSHGKFINALVSVALGIKPTANQPSVIFSCGDLSYIDLAYQPDKDVWWVKELGHLPPDVSANGRVS